MEKQTETVKPTLKELLLSDSDRFDLEIPERERVKSRLDDDFESFIDHVFKHEVADTSWYFEDDIDLWLGDPVQSVEYMTRLFSDPIEKLSKFTDAQLDQGFWYLLSIGGIMSELNNEVIPLTCRIACIQSIVPLFAKLFKLRCTDHLGHMSEPGAGALNSSCYMWWDIFPLHRQSKLESVKACEEASLIVMEEISNLESIACKESALHGLGHLQMYYPDQVKMIVEKFISMNKSNSSDLLLYAKYAAVGQIQ
jgi:hypothetical protein